MSLFAALEVSGTGLAAQRMRVELLVQNMANSQTTRTPEGGPYRRRDAVFMSEAMPVPFGALLASFGDPPLGVTVSEIAVDEGEPERRYQPGHPDADGNGYVLFPRTNPVEDMVDLTAAVRSFQANLAAIGAVKEMLNRSVDLLRA